MDNKEKAMMMHEKWRGKIEVISRSPLATREDLAVAYTPGVAQPCLEIAKDKSLSYTLTRRGNLVAVITDGTAVLGLGDIGPEAAMPVMEGKCVLFKHFAGVDAFPICLDTKDTDKIVETIKLLAPTFGGINLEDISAPRCFEIEKRLQNELDIPVFHDDQHGTAIVVIAALINSLRFVKKSIEDITIVINGAGAAGTAIARMLIDLKAGDIILCDSKGIIYSERSGNDPYKEDMAALTNKTNRQGSLSDAIKQADVFIGVSAPDTVTKEMVASMNRDAIVFAMANPVPEIMPDIAKEAGARIVGTGRSDFANQVNNVLAFPGIFKGALMVRATAINEEMKLAAALAIASLVNESDLNEERILPDLFDENVSKKIAEEVALAAVKTGVNRISAE